MSWRGVILEDDRVWGAEDATQTLVVGDPAVPPQGLPGPVMPEALMSGAGGLHLPPLGDIAAADRLALIGFFSLNEQWDGVAIVVSETAAIWATCSAREVIHAQGSATPRLAGALGVTAGPATGFDAALDRPERLPLLLHGTEGGAALGALLGAEIGATRTLWLGQQAVLIGHGPLAKGYAAALSAAHVPVTLTDRDALLRKGFDALAARFLPG